MEFVRIPAGEFNMGSPLVEPGRRGDENLHRVRLTHSFYLQTTEVTQVQWRAVVNAATGTTLNLNPSYFTHCGDACPVENVSWEDVQIFLDVLNTMYENAYEFHLPTEAQWEYAARAGSDTAFANGNISAISCGIDPVLDTMGWYCGNSDVNYEGCHDASGSGGPACVGIHPVARKNPNIWGLFDMHGNAAEWCSDWYEETYSATTNPMINPQGPENGTERVFRGGGWNNSSGFCRSACRHMDNPDDTYISRGFRLVCSMANN